ncbi:MAG: VWA domain-containing protein [Deltaproteobacteria bacterium]|nr:MAG: VWA domain-containing protein [Deltaproteobacteria bacterium]
MDQTLEDFISALRRSGVRTSISESIDAMQAVELIGYQDREILKNALSVALAKSYTEKEIFEECFEQFFAFEDLPRKEEAPAEPFATDLMGQDSLLTQMLLSGDSAGLAMAMSSAAREVDITSIQFFIQKALYIQKILRQMGLEGLNQDIQRLSQRDSLRDKARKLEEAKNELFETVRNFVERQFDLFASSATEEMIERYLKNIGLSNIEQGDFQRMRVIVQKMVKRFNTLYSRRRKTSNRGLLDFKKTLRKNVSYHGLLFEPKWKKRKIDRPDVVAICDVSRSVKNVSRFLILFLYSLNEVLERIRTFIFCSNLTEVSHVFDGCPVEEAITKLDTGTGLDVIMGRTDYGQAFLDFKESWFDTVTNKTTVLILGDARNNYCDPRTEILREIKERSRRLIWLNPESEPFWGTGDSEMKRYFPHCHIVRKCSTLTHLERLVEVLMRATTLH